MGNFVRALGRIGDKATENEVLLLLPLPLLHLFHLLLHLLPLLSLLLQVLLLEHDIPHSSFSEAVMDCLPEVTEERPWTITARDRAERVDCRHLDVCSVDPPGCTDIDDALHARPLPNGNLEVGVHIADVGHFIRPGTAVDREAADRATTVYLTDRRIDMVPCLLSSDLCSLRGGVERFAFSCIWEMTRGAEIVSTKFHKSVIKSRRAMTYEAAQDMIDDTGDESSLATSLRTLLALSKVLKQRRVDNGSLKFMKMKMGLPEEDWEVRALLPLLLLPLLHPLFLLAFLLRRTV